MDHSTDNGPDPDATRDGGPALDADAQDLKATEDSIRSDLGRLTRVEAEKQSLEPTDPRVDALSDEAVELAERIHRQTRAERELSKELG